MPMCINIHKLKIFKFLPSRTILAAIPVGSPTVHAIAVCLVGSPRTVMVTSRRSLLPSLHVTPSSWRSTTRSVSSFSVIVSKVLVNRNLYSNTVHYCVHLWYTCTLLCKFYCLIGHAVASRTIQRGVLDLIPRSGSVTAFFCTETHSNKQI